MSLFANHAVNRVYLHGAIRAFAETGGGIFVFVFLLDAGLSIPQVLCSIAAINMARYVLRAAVLPLAHRIGLRNCVVAGTMLESSSYWLVPWVDGLGVMLALFIAIGSVGSVLYWTSFHAYVAATGDEDNRGTQVGLIEAFNALVAAIAPAVASLILVFAGPKEMFAVIALVQMAAAIPLLSSAEVPIPELEGDDRAVRRFGARLYFFDGLTVAFTHFVWQLALFVSLGSSLENYGGAMVLAGLVGAAMSLAIGRFIDFGHGRASVLVAYAAAIASTIAKGFAVGSATLAISAAAFAAIAMALQIPVMMTRLYNLAKQSHCPLRFHMASEAGWDLGSAGGCLFAALLVWSGVSMGAAIMIAIAGYLLVSHMLWASYGEA
jgi:MFS transporter, DHA1 family, inner membrane transport protein